MKKRQKETFQDGGWESPPYVATKPAQSLIAASVLLLCIKYPFLLITILYAWYDFLGVKYVCYLQEVLKIVLYGVHVPLGSL